MSTILAHLGFSRIFRHRACDDNESDNELRQASIDADENLPDIATLKAVLTLTHNCPQIINHRSIIMDLYPADPKNFPSLLRRHLTSDLDPRPVETIEGVSASKWTESHLYLLRVVITQTGFDENSKKVPFEAKEFLRTAEAHLKENTRLRTVLEAVKGKDHHLPIHASCKSTAEESQRRSQLQCRYQGSFRAQKLLHPASTQPR